MKERLWGKVVRRVAQLQAKGYQSTCSNTRKFMCNLLLRKSDGKKARFIIIIKNRCIFACNDFFASYKDFRSIPTIFIQRFRFFCGKLSNDYATQNLRWGKFATIYKISDVLYIRKASNFQIIKKTNAINN